MSFILPEKMSEDRMNDSLACLRCEVDTTDSLGDLAKFIARAFGEKAKVFLSEQMKLIEREDAVSLKHNLDAARFLLQNNGYQVSPVK